MTAIEAAQILVVSLLVVALFLTFPLLVLVVWIVPAFLLHKLWNRIRGNPRAPSASAESRRAAGRVRARMTRMAQPTLLLTPSKGAVFSKLGGDPELPASLPWPLGEKAPRAFLAQIDLAAASAAGAPDWLPTGGRLYVFHDDQRYGFADLVRVLHSDEAPGAPRPPPPDLPAKQRFLERRADFKKFTSVPSLDWLGVDVGDLDDDAVWDELSDLHDAPFGDELQHRIGGYPSEIQNASLAVECEYLRRGIEPDWSAPVPPAIARASRQWRLLVQIDSDAALKMAWGDSGRLYVFIREADARAGDFSRTVALSQWC
ncbi:DUF1963 domain-containing protein [Phenylobacterium sp.]|uniref:DUF1963 domain-containing protein n=1 Tax=Phenylobacterium sp. TaxID=1871053 RepID=UPI0039833414